MTQKCQSERVRTTTHNWRFGWIARPLPPPQRGCPAGDPGPQAVLTALAIIIALGSFAWLSGTAAAGQSHTARHRAKRGSICGNPTASCKTSVTFHEYDLPFRVPANAVIFDTELFYAVILKSVAAAEGDCNAFVSETDRLAAQLLFSDRKVFSSRCIEPGELFYTNVSEKHRIMAVYAGTTLAEAKHTLAAVKATGKFPGAYMRRMRTGFNGT